MTWEVFRKGTRRNIRCEFVRGGAPIDCRAYTIRRVEWCASCLRLSA